MLASIGRSAEFHGFSAVAGRTSSFIWSTVFGIVVAHMSIWLQSRRLVELTAKQAGQRITVLFSTAFLLVEDLLLLLVNERAGRRTTERT